MKNYLMLNFALKCFYWLRIIFIYIKFKLNKFHLIIIFKLNIINYFCIKKMKTNSTEFLNHKKNKKK